ncbi:hypothetical protein KI659_17965 [Litoribacter alkaliphilus]|uniref:Phage tail protein n=1 Tax=Litoribacter ruber TaxID=702568 RepID=A0AAP2CQ74_9BACT|nr:phage tail tube protein [Litoribacter alkaliphilus]MBS9525912.1 hypothetical protein [Litoribacter alkaliphilus]
MNSNANKVLIKLKDKTDSGEPIVLAGQTSTSIDFTNDVREYTSKTTVDANGVPVRRYLPTRFGATISIESLYDPTGTLTNGDILEMCYNQVAVDFLLGNDESGSKVIKGAGFISSASASFGMDETSSSSFTLQVDGGITFETVA